MKWTNSVIAIAALCVVSAFQSANATTQQCDNCDEYTIQRIANDNIYSLKMSGPLYVVDLEQGTVRKFVYRNNWTPESNPEFDPFEEWVEEWPAEASFVSGIQRAGQLARAAPDIVIVNPDRNDLPIDAHAAINTTIYDGPIGQYIQTMSVDHGTNELVSWLRGLEGNAFFSPQSLTKQIKLLYQDGSSAIYFYDIHEGVYKKMPKSSRDSAGNLIPEKKDDATGLTYEFPNALDGNDRSLDDFADMEERLRRLGYKFVDATSNHSGPTLVMTCTDTTCTIWIIY
ncbi:MAG: hypothetical protein ACREXR_07190 [Gammaproteobacteria bacterium]